MKKINPELARDELWRRGNLSWKFHAGQREINTFYNKMRGQLFVCNISRQFGKTVYSVIKAIELAIQKPNAIIRYGTAFLVDLLRFIIPAFKMVMQDCPESIKGQYLKKGSVFIFPNGSRIDLVGIDKNPDAMRGNSVDMFVIDEAGYVDRLEYLYNSVIVPSTTHRPDCKVLMVSSAPSTPDHEFKMFCDKADKEGAYVMLTIYDHPTITKETIERLANEVGGKDTTTFRREFLCEFVTDSNLAIIPEWSNGNLPDDKHKWIQDVPKDEFYSFYHKYDGMDIGYRDLTAVIFGYYHFKMAALVIEDEVQFHGPTETIKTMSAKIKQKETELWGDQKPHKRIADNNNLTLLNDMNVDYGIIFNATGKEALQAMVTDVRIMVNAGRVIVHPRCTKLIGCLRSGIWNAKKTIFNRSRDFGHFDHLAALIYLIRNLDLSTNPIPATYGLSHQTHWMKNLKNQQNVSQSMLNLAAAFPKGNN